MHLVINICIQKFFLPGPKQSPSGTTLTKNLPRRLPSTVSRVAFISPPSPFVDEIPHIGVCRLRSRTRSRGICAKKSVMWPSKYAKMRFPQGLRSGPRWGRSLRSPNLLVGWGENTQFYHFGARLDWEGPLSRNIVKSP